MGPCGFCIFAGQMRRGIIRGRWVVGHAGVVTPVVGLPGVGGRWQVSCGGWCWRQVGYGTLMRDCAQPATGGVGAHSNRYKVVISCDQTIA